MLVLIANAGLIAVEELSPTGADLRLYGFLRFGLPQLRSELHTRSTGFWGETLIDHCLLLAGHVFP